MPKMIKSILHLSPDELEGLAQKTGRTVAELRASAEQSPPTEDHAISERLQAKMNSGSYSTKCAASLVSLLGEACARIEPVGDIRMRRPEATEVALVLIPKVEVEPDLLGEQMGENRLAEKLKMLQKIGILTP